MMIVKTNIVKDVKFKDSELFDKEAAITLKNRMNALVHKKEELADKHMEAMILEQEILKEEAELLHYKHLVEIEYEVKEIESFEREECNLVINNPDDARNI